MKFLPGYSHKELSFQRLRSTSAGTGKAISLAEQKAIQLTDSSVRNYRITIVGITQAHAISSHHAVAGIPFMEQSTTAADWRYPARYLFFDEQSPQGDTPESLQLEHANLSAINKQLEQQRSDEDTATPPPEQGL